VSLDAGAKKQSEDGRGRGLGGEEEGKGTGQKHSVVSKLEGFDHVTIQI